MIVTNRWRTFAWIYHYGHCAVHLLHHLLERSGCKAAWCCPFLTCFLSFLVIFHSVLHLFVTITALKDPVFSVLKHLWGSLLGETSGQSDLFVAWTTIAFAGIYYYDTARVHLLHHLLERSGCKAAWCCPFLTCFPSLPSVFFRHFPLCSSPVCHIHLS